ncbi:hypothetical protein Psi02_22540 [Planotetraspora silvatica]|uniref:Uncharacterized protein n=1 Tax=Planotetraspora silvatica TaxID=234614 RepID=A0A8J3XM32_9ACTN|nr:hypothetical protein Psi02_22540 [Planotetraspora silvatica]
MAGAEQDKRVEVALSPQEAPVQACHPAVTRHGLQDADLLPRRHGLARPYRGADRKVGGPEPTRMDDRDSAPAAD